MLWTFRDFKSSVSTKLDSIPNEFSRHKRISKTRPYRFSPFPVFALVFLYFHPPYPLPLGRKPKVVYDAKTFARLVASFFFFDQRQRGRGSD